MSAPVGSATNPALPSATPEPSELITVAPPEAPLSETEKSRKRMLDAISKVEPEPVSQPGTFQALPLHIESAVNAAVQQPPLLESLPPPRNTQALGRGELLTDGIGGITGNLISALPVEQDQSVLHGFHRRRFALQGGVGFGLTSINTIRPGPGDLRETYATISPNIDASFGDQNAGRFVRLTSLTGISFTDKEFRNVDEDLDLRGSYAFNRLRVGAGFSFSRLSGISRDVGTDVVREYFTGSGTVAYAYSPKTTMALELSVPVQRYSGRTSSQGVTVVPSINYQYSPRTGLGLDVAAGTLDVSGGEKQVFERPSFRISYSVNEKISFRGSLGMEHRDAGDTSTNTPTFELDAIWRLRESTSISLSSERRVSSASQETAVNYTSTVIQLGISQRIGSRLRGNVAFGFEDAVYDSLSSSLDVGRHDKLSSGRADLTYILSPYVSIILTGSAVDNSSNQQPFRTYQGSLQSVISF